ncbi:UDP-glucose 4-epimerase GalE [Hellea balneolensis]|uniref:UDP-glucose 4-epimerase GalE n=1 Tax=Hellea balneolensis TaxID=287478 RepID=UPI000419E521|nr:UDP-glucose 4-epimerase GalE [Hellea balneolensis]
MTFDLTGKTVIVVGGAGYIGAHVCKAVADNGGIPVTFDNFSSGHRHAVKWGPSETVDLRDKAATLDAFTKHKSAHAVVHLASSIEVGIGEKDPAGFYENNVVGALNLLEAMRELSLTNLIFSSTCATYGETDQMPLLESQVQNPFSVYGKTKLAIEHMIQSYHKAYGLAYITLRYFNASGADSSGLIGEEHDPETHLIPIALAAAVGLRGKMKIFGTDYDTPDGTCIRDYIHVSDIASAHIYGLEAFANGLTQTEVNIGTGKGVSNLEILKMIETVTGHAVAYDAAPRRDGDLTRLYADPKRAKEVLGFTAEHSNLKNIIQTAWKFHQGVWNIK